MIRRVFLTVTVAAFAIPMFGDVLPFDIASRRVYLLRIQPASGIDYEFRSDRAIWSYDDAEKRFERLAPFRYDSAWLHLGAFEDRIVAQGNDWYEFDLASGRFLRRYEAIRDATLWTFSGAIVTDSIASRLGIKAGTYGFFHCVTLNVDPPPPCESSPGGEDTARGLFLRPLDPARAEFTLVGETATNPAASHLSQRFIAADPEERRFLLWSTRTAPSGQAPNVHELSALTADAAGSLVETLLMREADAGTDHFRAADFAFVPRTRTAFHLMDRVSPGSARFFTRRSLETLGEELIDVVEHADLAVKGTILSEAITGVPATLPERYEQLVPIVGDAPGAHGTYWRSDLWLFNPSGEASEAELRRVTRPEMKTTVTIPPRGSVAIRNILRHLGGGPHTAGGDGIALDAVVLTSPYRWGAQISAYSRAYTHSTAAAESGGTFGQAVPAVPTRIGYSNHVSSFDQPYEAPHSTPSHLILDREVPGQFRHNLGVVNDSDEPITIRLSSHSFTVAPHSVSNVNLDVLLPANVQRLGIAGDRPAAIWLSMIDNRTGDATFIPFTLFGLRAVPDSWTAVPGVARTRGANGTWWWTDLYGEFRSVDRGEVWHEPRARLQAAGCSSEPKALVGGGHFFRDVVRLAGCDEVDRLGALELRTSSWTAGFTRTYTTREDGGTYGEMLPFYPYGGWPIQHFAGVQLDQQFRVNVGLYNGMERDVTYTLRLYEGDGALAYETTVTLASRESRQSSLQVWFGAEVEPGLYGLTVVPHDEPSSQGRSWAYVSVVDNVTNDPTNWW